MKIYKADNLGQIAAHFESMAALAAKRGRTSKTKTEQKLNEREAVVWNQAADMLRNTELTNH